MRSIFQMGFRGNAFSIGQVQAPGSLMSRLDYAMGQYAAVEKWLASTYAAYDVLAGDSVEFDSMESQIRSIYDVAFNVLESLHAGVTSFSQEELDAANSFIDLAPILWGTILRHDPNAGIPAAPAPAPAPAPAAPPPAAPRPATVTPAPRPAVRPPVPGAAAPRLAPAPEATIFGIPQTTALIGTGALLAVGLIAAIA